MAGPQRHEVLDWLGDAALYDSAARRDEIAATIGASGSSDEADWLAIMEQATGTLDLPASAAETTRRYLAYDESRRRLHASIREAVAAGMSEHEAARVTGVSRMTVRKALGKS